MMDIVAIRVLAGAREARRSRCQVLDEVRTFLGGSLS